AITEQQEKEISSQAVKNQEQMDLAKHFITRFASHVRVIHGKGPIYVYCDGSNLWKGFSLGEFAMVVHGWLCADFAALKETHEQLPQHGHDPEQKERLKNYITLIGQLLSRLGNVGFLDSVTKAICRSIANPA